MLKVGITGGMGTGKSAVLALLKEKGYPTISADDLVHQLMAKGQKAYDKIIAEFGKDILDEADNIDRRRLAELIFSTSEARHRLEAIIHILVKEEILKQIAHLKLKGKLVVFVEVPLLYEVGWENLFSTIWLVKTSYKLQKERLLASNKFNEDEIARRLSAQMPLEEKINRANYVLDNKGDFSELKFAVEQGLKSLFLDELKSNKEG